MDAVKELAGNNVQGPYVFRGRHCSRGSDGPGKDDSGFCCLFVQDESTTVRNYACNRVGCLQQE